MIIIVCDSDVDFVEVFMVIFVIYFIREGSGLGYFSIDNEGKICFCYIYLW